MAGIYNNSSTANLTFGTGPFYFYGGTIYNNGAMTFGDGPYYFQGGSLILNSGSSTTFGVGDVWFYGGSITANGNALTFRQRRLGLDRQRHGLHVRRVVLAHVEGLHRDRDDLRALRRNRQSPGERYVQRDRADRVLAHARLPRRALRHLGRDVQSLPVGIGVRHAVGG